MKPALCFPPESISTYLLLQGVIKARILKNISSRLTQFRVSCRNVKKQPINGFLIDQKAIQALPYKTRQIALDSTLGFEKTQTQ